MQLQWVLTMQTSMAQFTNVNSKQHILTVCIFNTQKMKNCNTNNRKVNIHTQIQQKTIHASVLWSVMILNNYTLD